MRHENIVGAGVFIIALGLYLKTMAPTISLWDSGEFIACAYTLGIPHPPGAPLYILWGRLFALLPVGSVEQRVVLISPLVSAAAIWCVFSTTTLLPRGALKSGGTPFPSQYQRLAALAGGVVAALSLACSYTFWFNATEAEVYACSIFVVCLSVWLALRWSVEPSDEHSYRWLLFIVYMFGLSGGVHLLCLLTIPAILILIRCADSGLRRLIWVLLVLGGSGLIVMAVWGPSKTGGAALILALAAGLYYLYRRDRHSCGLLIAALVLFGLGYSTYATLYIRSGLNPVIDENDPETWAALIKFLGREQYGTESLLAGMLEAKASRLYQFWHLQMKYFFEQFQFPLGESAVKFRRATDPSQQSVAVSVLPYLLGLGGLLWQARRDWQRFLVVLALFTTMGFGLSAYLNMSDPQPRERHYVFVGMFYAFALWMGLGWSGLVETLGRRLCLSTRWLVALAGAGVLLPVGMGVKLYNQVDRTGDYLGRDYGYNLLQSCAPNSILFTNGDNDTFPLWFLQEVEGIRPDVGVVHVGLLNTGWYIKQLRQRLPAIDIRYTDTYIDSVLTDTQRVDLGLRHWPGPKTIELAGLEIEVVPFEQRMLRVQDIAVLKIVEWNDWGRPIFFSVAVPVENQVGLTPYLSLNGLAYRLVREREPGLDQKEMERNFYRVFQWRNLLGREMTSDPGIAPLLFNYQAAVMQLADFYRQKGMDEALAQLLAWASQRIPFVWHAYYSASTYLQQMGQHQLAFEYAERAVQKLLDTYGASGNATYDDLIDLMDELTKKYRDSAWSAKFYRQIIEVEPGRWEAYYRLASLMGVQGDYSGGLQVVDEYIGRHGEVRPLVRLRQNLRQALRKGSNAPE